MSRTAIVARDPEWVTEMTTLTNALIDQGLRSGLCGMARTPGLYVSPAAEVDVLALALRRALTYGIPLSATVGEVLERLTLLQAGDDVRPMAATTLHAESAVCPSLSAAVTPEGGPTDAA